MILLRRWHFIPKSGIVKLNTSILYSIALFLSKRSKTLKKIAAFATSTVIATLSGSFLSKFHVWMPYLNLTKA